MAGNRTPKRDDNDDNDDFIGGLLGALKGALNEREQRMVEQTGMHPDFVFHKQPLHGKTGKLVFPEKATITHVGEQNGVIYAWYAFAVGMEEKIEIPYALIGDGEKMDFTFKNEMEYFRTVQMSDGLVWHVCFGEAKQL